MDTDVSINIDQPTTDDRLGFDLYARGIIHTIRDATTRNQLPLVIGIYGRWGSGKTSLMKMVEAGLTQLENFSTILSTQETRHVLAFLWTACALWATFTFRIIFCAATVTRWHDLRIVIEVLSFVVCWLFLAVGVWVEGRLRRQPTRLGLVKFWSAQGLSIGVFVVTFLAMLWLDRRFLFHDQAGILVYTAKWFIVGFACLGAVARTAFDIWWTGVAEKNIDNNVCFHILNRVPLSFSVTGCIFSIFARQFLILQYWPSKVIVVSSLILAFVVGLSPIELTNAPVYVWSAIRRWWQNEQTRKQQFSSMQPLIQVIWFNAWKYSDEKELWAALLQRILTDLRISAIGSSRVRIKWTLWRRSIDWRAGALAVAKRLLPVSGKAIVTAGIGIATFMVTRYVIPSAQSEAAATAAGLITSASVAAVWLRTYLMAPIADLDLEQFRRKSTYKDHLGFLTEFSSELERVTRIARGAGNPIVIMLDDLDRCLPAKAVSVLEAIKLFVGDNAPVVFVIGADREFVERAIDVNYVSLQDTSDPNIQRKERFSQLGHEYLEKIVGLAFNLPPIEIDAISRFILQSFPEDPLVADNATIFAAGLLANPRQVLRAVSTFRFIAALANEKGVFYNRSVRAEILAKLIVVQYRWPDLYGEIVEQPNLLAKLEHHYQQPEKLGPSENATLDRHLGKPGLRQMLTLPPSLVGVDLGPYLFFTSRSQEAAEVSSEDFSADDGTAARKNTAAQTVERPVEPAETDRRVQLVRKDLAGLEELVTELTKRGADSALISRLLGQTSQIKGLLESNAVDQALKSIEEATAFATKVLRDIDASRSTQMEIDAEVSKNAVIQFQTAISYGRVELHIEESRALVTFALLERNNEIVRWAIERKWLTKRLGIDLFEARSRSQPDTEAFANTVSELLGEKLSLMFTEGSPSRRLHIISGNTGLDELPWEALRLDSDDHFLAIDPRHSVVRGSKNSVDESRKLLYPLEMVIVALSGSREIHDRVEMLGVACNPLVEKKILRVRIVAYNPDRNIAWRDDIENAHLVHIISDDISLVAEGLQDKGSFARFGRTLHRWSTRIVTLDCPASREIASELSQHVLAVVGMQKYMPAQVKNEFSIPFYRALFRTGQADFAITEGRRAIATISNSVAALCPVLYLSPHCDSLFEFGATSNTAP